MNEEPAKLIIRVHPGASKNMITGCNEGILNIKITTRPEKGKANETLIRFLSDLLGIAKSRISIVKGNTTRNKLVAIQGVTTSTAISRLLETYDRKSSD